MELMIKEKEILINITSRNISNYLSKGYNVKNGDKYTIDINDLPNNSHVKITAICEICGNEYKLMFAKYNENKKRYGFYSCKKCSNKKREKTSYNKWGGFLIIEKPMNVKIK